MEIILFSPKQFFLSIQCSALKYEDGKKYAENASIGAELKKKFKKKAKQTANGFVRQKIIKKYRKEICYEKKN